jgi:hypothetical protein
MNSAGSVGRTMSGFGGWGIVRIGVIVATIGEVGSCDWSGKLEIVFHKAVQFYTRHKSSETEDSQFLWVSRSIIDDQSILCVLQILLV